MMEYLSTYLREGMFINQLEEWQIKIVDEFREVGRRKTKLGLFQTLDDKYTKLSTEDKELIWEQLLCMQEYEDVLRRRIDRFVIREINDPRNT